MKLLIGMMLLFCFYLAFADTTTSSTTTTIVGQAALNSVSGAVDKIPTAIPVTFTLVFGFVIEMIMRFIPTAKPRSIFLLIAQMFSLVGKGFTKISDLLDLLVQNIKT